MTTISLPMLSRVQIASPCPVRWDEMNPVGDGEQVRHCDQCNLNVYNISAMTSDEAEALLVAHEGRRLCGAFYRREDGTILTKDCPVGLALVRARMAKVVARLSAAAGLIMSGVILLGAKARGEPARLRDMDPFARIVAWLNPAAPMAVPVSGKIAMPMPGGIMVCPPPTPTPSPTPAPSNASPGSTTVVSTGGSK